MSALLLNVTQGHLLAMELMCEIIRNSGKLYRSFCVYILQGVRVTVYAIGSDVDARTV